MSKVSGFNGILLRLGDFPPDTIISERRLASLMGKHEETIRRWRRDNKLPPSWLWGNERVWTVRFIINFINEKLEELQRKSKNRNKRLDSI